MIERLEYINGKVADIHTLSSAIKKDVLTNDITNAEARITELQISCLELKVVLTTLLKTDTDEMLNVLENLFRGIMLR